VFRDSRPTALAGLTFVVLSVIGIAMIGSEPHLNATPQLLAGYLRNHRTALLTTNALLSVANGALLVFAVSLRRWMPDYAKSLVVVAAGVLCAIGAATATIPAALAHYGTSGFSDAQTRTLMAVYYTGNAFSAMPAALIVGTVAVVAARGGGRRVLAGASAAIALVQVAMTFTLLGSGSFAPDAGSTAGVIFGLLTLWVAAVSVSSLRPGR
jgi:hypothetical protein